MILTKNQSAFLYMTAISELTGPVISGSDNGYNVLVGSTPHKIMIFPSYSDHPRIYNKKLNSTAAGRYQLLAHNYDYYKKFLNLNDFSPDSQDAIAIQQIRECNALKNIEAGNIKIAIAECSRIWASLPGNSYGQHQNNLDKLCQLYADIGGTVA